MDAYVEWVNRPRVPNVDNRFHYTALYANHKSKRKFAQAFLKSYVASLYAGFQQGTALNLRYFMDKVFPRNGFNLFFEVTEPNVILDENELVERICYKNHLNKEITVDVQLWQAADVPTQYIKRSNVLNGFYVSTEFFHPEWMTLEQDPFNVNVTTESDSSDNEHQNYPRTPAPADSADHEVLVSFVVPGTSTSQSHRDLSASTVNASLSGQADFDMAGYDSPERETDYSESETEDSENETAAVTTLSSKMLSSKIILIFFIKVMNFFSSDP